MAAGLNQFVGIGNLTAKPEVTYTKSGTARCKFAIAINRRHKDAAEQWVDEVTFVPIIVWGERGETVAKYLDKGRQVCVTGRLRIDSFENADGNRVKVIEIVASDVQFLGKKPEGTTPATTEDEDSPEIAEEEVPF